MIHEQQQSSVRLLSSDNIDMDLPSSVEETLNNIHPKPELPGYMLNSLSELKDHGFDSDSNAPVFYWSEHQLPGSGVRNLTANAFSLPTQQVTNEEARFSLTISSLLIRENCLLNVCSRQQTASILNYQFLETHEFLHPKMIFKSFIYLDQRQLFLIFHIRFPRQQLMAHMHLLDYQIFSQMS